MRNSHWFLFIFALSLGLGPLYGAQAHVCRNAVGLREVVFHPETSLEVVTTAKSHAKISELLQKLAPKTIQISHPRVMAGLSDLFQDRRFLLRWAQRLHFENLSVDSELTKFHYTLIPTAESLTFRVQIQMEFQNVKIQFEKPELEILGSNVSLGWIHRLIKKNTDSQNLKQEIKMEIRVEFNESGEMQATSNEFPQVSNLLAQEWNERTANLREQMPFRLSQLTISPESDFSLGLKPQSATKSQNQKCQISCEDFDFAVALNQSSLNTVVNQVFKIPQFQNHLKKSLQGLTLEKVQLVILEKQVTSNTLPFLVQLKLKVTPEHALWPLVRRDFMIHVQLRLEAQLGPEGKALQFDLQKIEPQALHFAENDFRFPLRLLAGLTPEFIKQRLHKSLVNLVHHQVKIHLPSIEFDSWLPFPALELVALGSDPVQRHPYLAFRLKTNSVD
ncbi:MAG: hypothetical protein ACK5V3_03395 [Bdellovibrionales bacterium]